MRSVAVLGSTGSIGTQTLEVIRRDPERFDVVALAAGTSVEMLLAQALEFEPEVIVVGGAAAAAELRSQLPSGITVDSGPDALAAAARMADVAMNGVVGFAGLPVTLAALEAGARLGLANKESLIAAGPVVQRARHTEGAELIPVDSEHCAVHQCLRANDGSGGNRLDQVERVLVTASGGPFRGRSPAQLAGVTVGEALAHPTWDMGPKITIDSSTLMNKGLEVIEAHELFGVPYDRIEVVVHPQSVVHSMVEFTDGATIAQLSLPDMRLCIAYALAFPDRSSTPFGRIDWSELHRLDFEAPDTAAFRCLDLAYEAGRCGETAPAWLNAANEVAVAAFLEGSIEWLGIAEVIDAALQRWPGWPAGSVEEVVRADHAARDTASALIHERMAS